MSLTDEQCNEFKRSKGTFDDMVRAIYEAGQADEREACAEMCIDDAKRSRDFAEPFAAVIAEDLAEAIRARSENNE